MRLSTLWLTSLWLVGCSVPAPGTDDDGADASAGNSGASGATVGTGGSGGAPSGGKAGASPGGAAQAGASGDPFGGGAGAAQAGTTQGGSGGASQVCSPGQQIACACPGGAQGAQACNPSGTGYEPCDCPGGPGGAAGSTSAGGAAGAAGPGGASSGGGAGSTSVDPVGDAEKCPGAELSFSGATIVVAGTTKPATGDYAPNKCVSAASSDVVYRFVAPKSGVVTATVAPTGFDAVVYWSETACDGYLPKACSASKGGYGEPESIELAVVAGKSYWVFVDGWTAGFAGAFELSLSY